ncbi:MAG: AAA family ATPase [Leucobacter sp.]
MSTPALRFRALRRGRIRDRIGASADALSPLTLLRAPAGFGKTTAATHWTEDLIQAAEVDVRWVRSPEPENDARLIWHRIREALRGDTKPCELSRVRDDIDRALVALARPTALVIDDYQHVTSGDLDIALSRLLDRSSHLYLVVLSRRFTALDGPLVSSRVSASLLTDDELSFTEAESLQLAEFYGVTDLDYVAQLHRESNGWPMMMRATLQESSDGASPRDSARTLGIFGRHYLGEVTVPGARRALLGAVLCPEISIEMLAELIGMDIVSVESVARELCEHGLLQESFWEHTTRYRCHAGFAASLEALALQEFGDDAREIRQRHAADFGRDDPVAATMQMLDAEEYDAVSRLMARYFLGIMRPGTGVLQRLNQIPDPILREYPVLIGALLYADTPEHEMSNQRVEHLYQWLRAAMRSELREGNYEQNIAAVGLLLTAERMRGDGAEALRISRDAEARIERVPENRLASYRFTFPLLFSALGFAGLVAGDLELGERNYRRSVETAQRFNNRLEELRGWNGMAAVAVTAGDPRAAEEHLLRARELSERAGIDAPQFSGFNAFLAEAVVAVERGAAERALRVLPADRGVLRRIE